MQHVAYHGELWPNKEGKMLDPSGCFYFTKPGIAVRVCLAQTHKITGQVSNTIANKTYFTTARKLHATKSYARSLAIDFR